MKMFTSKLSLPASTLTAIATAMIAASGCEVTGGYTVGVPDAASCESPDAAQISVVYQTPAVPNYLTVSINNDEFIFDECFPDPTQSGQGEFQIRRTADTEIQIGLTPGSSMRRAYFPEESLAPYRSDLSVKIFGRFSCSQMPTLILPTTYLPIIWQSSSAGFGRCSENNWLGTAVIQ